MYTGMIGMDILEWKISMGVADIISLLGGVAMFLFGMALMGDALKRVAGNKLELILWRLSNTPLKGVLLGTGVTAVVQSSSATTVMVVGFVNSGMMTVRQAIGVIMGANIGTSVTAWVLCLSMLGGMNNGWISLLSTSTLTAIVALVGILIRMISKSQSKRHFGEILLGFAVLMYGMQAMAAAVAPLSESAKFGSVLSAFENPAIGILAGIVVTAVLQSASASVGVLQSLTITGAISYATTLPLIMGIGIGASVPVLFSAIGANRDGKRTSLLYLVINVFGTLICSGLFYGLTLFIDFPFMNTTASSVGVAFINSLYRVAMVVVLFPFVGQLERFARFLVRDDADEKGREDDGVLYDNLEERFITHPALAVEQSRLAMCDMADKVKENLTLAISLLGKYNKSTHDSVIATENIIDTYEDKLGTYLVRITGREMGDMQNKNVSRFLHTISDFERIGDHAMNLAKAANEISRKHIEFTHDAEHELKTITNAVMEIVSISFSSFENDDVALAYRVEPLEEMIDILCDKAKHNHVERVRAGECTLEHGFVFNDMITDLERIADHCSNIGVAMIELESNLFDTHEYLTNLKKLKTSTFSSYFDEYERKYGF